jgi:hypothetical protein
MATNAGHQPRAGAWLNSHIEVVPASDAVLDKPLARFLVFPPAKIRADSLPTPPA